MNIEPIAYINVEERKLEWAVPIEWHTPTIAKMDKVPLYTHPSDRISELEQQLKEEIQARADALDDLNNRMMKFMKSYNEMAWKLDEVGGAYTHPVKELTEWEIEECWDEATGMQEHFCSQYFDFAKLILRKAQEK